MAYAKKTLADLKQSLADRHDSGTLPTDSATLTFWIRLLNRGQAYCADRLKMEKSTSLTTSSGSVALPDDFISVSKAWTDDGYEYKMVDPDNKDAQTGYSYWITGNHDSGFTFNIPYSNSNDDDTFTIYYSFRPSDMSSDADECIIPDPEAVVAYAYSFLRKSETDPIGDAKDAMNECDVRLAEVLSANTLNNNFEGFTLQSNA